jgi:hypothetical protein
MHFILIVKNSFSFYVEFETLLHFLLFYRLLNVNNDVNIRNDAWNEMDRSYTKKSSENHFWTKITDRNCATLFRALRTASIGCWRWDAEEGHGVLIDSGGRKPPPLITLGC